ncbi:phage virion morphogenesis protein [Sodalis sp. RH18]|uniref:phage virion morphogenesis protein n=1 Tax=Sodalis sp. RH18 TaxID=3394333 RepID=UPI0039B5B4E3
MPAPVINGELNKTQLRALKDALRAAEMPKAKRQRLLWRIAKLGIIAASKRNARNQRTPDGSPWPARKRGKRKMLRQLPKLLHVRELPQIDAVRIYLQGGHYKNGNTPVAAGLIGAVHQGGANITGRADSYKNQPKQEGKLATNRQARKLRQLGYQVMWQGRRVKPAMAWITKEMSMAQAGMLIKKLSKAPKKRTWTIDIPARVFLGVSDAEFNQILARQLQAIGFGWEVKAQDIKGKI